MILDTSALDAILYREPEAATFAQAIHDADACRIRVASYVALSMVIERQLGPEGMRQTEAYFRRAGITIEPVTIVTGEISRQAFLDLGKGRHKTGMKVAERFYSALSKATDQPLCVTGHNFT